MERRRAGVEESMAALESPAAVSGRVDTYESFHSVYDLPDYASLFGSFDTVNHSGSAIVFAMANGIAVSGPGASFGGLLLNPVHVRQPKLKSILEMIEGLAEQVRKQHREVRGIHIRLAPDVYYPASFIEVLHSAFALAGWSNSGEITHIVPKAQHRIANSTLRNVKKAGSSCRTIPLDPYTCFDFLAEIKLAKGFRFDYLRPRFLNQFQKFPHHFHCYGVEGVSGHLLAASFELVSPEWALLLNWDQSEAGKRICATDFLLHERLQDLFDRGCRFVDMGTTSICRKVNWGLVRHKENFGSCASIRNRYELVCQDAASSDAQDCSDEGRRTVDDATNSLRKNSLEGLQWHLLTAASC